MGAVTSPEPRDATQSSAPPQQPQHSSQSNRRTAEAPPIPDPSAHTQSKAAARSRPTPARSSAPCSKGTHFDISSQSETQRHTRVGTQDPPRARHASTDSGASTTPKALTTTGPRPRATPARTTHQHTSYSAPASHKPTPQRYSATSPSVASGQAHYAPPLRHSPPLHEQERQRARQLW